MVKRVKRLMIAASLLMLLSACGKAENADLPRYGDSGTGAGGTDTGGSGGFRLPWVKKKRPDRKKKAPQRQAEDSETSANSETTEIPDDAVMIQDVAARLL